MKGRTKTKLWHKLRHALTRGLGKILYVVPTVSAVHIPDHFPIAARSLLPQIPVSVGCQDMTALTASLRSAMPAQELAPRVQSLSAAAPPVPIFHGAFASQPATVRRFDGLTLSPIAIFDRLRRPGASLVGRVCPIPVAGTLRARTQAYDMASVFFAKNVLCVRTGDIDLFSDTSVRAWPPAPAKAVVNDDTVSARGWRVRRRSLDLDRMPQASWDGYFNEVVRQKQVPAADVELIGVFIVPERGLQDLSIDVDHPLIYFRIAEDHRRPAAAGTLIVARSKSTGTLRTVMDRRAPSPTHLAPGIGQNTGVKKPV